MCPTIVAVNFCWMLRCKLYAELPSFWYALRRQFQGGTGWDFVGVVVFTVANFPHISFRPVLPCTFIGLDSSSTGNAC